MKIYNSPSDSLKVGFMGSPNSQKPYKADSSDDEDEGPEIGYFVEERRSAFVRFFLDGPLGSPSRYRQIIQVLLSASEGDEIEIWINSPGGRLDTCTALCNAIGVCKGYVKGYVNGVAYSAAGMIALACHEITMLPFSTFMVHEASFGIPEGKNSDNKAYSSFTDSETRNYALHCYEGFMSPSELEEVLAGKTFWFSEKETTERLAKRQAYFEEKHAEALREAEEVLKRPKKVSKKTSSRRS